YQHANLISPEELTLILRVDKKTATELNAVLDKLLRVDNVQYILVLLDDMLAGTSVLPTVEVQGFILNHLAALMSYAYPIRFVL
ncbi:hypothetical protein BC938DRAFT_478668, partial [Jimgerdemannia flammicorona]